MAGLSAGPRGRLTLPATTHCYTYIASYFLLCFLAGYHILRIFYYECASLTNMSPFRSTAFAECFVGCSKDAHFTRQM